MNGSNQNPTSIQLPDGRRLGYAEFGNPTGKPLFIFNGSASRLFYPMDDAVTRALNIRIITVDRPGFGISDFNANHSLLAWADAIEKLANQLRLAQFAVAGGSAGGPFAAACAYKLPQRITKLGLISSLAPFDAPETTKGMSFAYRLIPFFAHRMPKFLAFTQSLAMRRPEMLWKQFYKRLPACDKAVLQTHPEIDMKQLLLNDVPEIYRQGSAGIIKDMQVLTSAWGFDPAAIRVKTYIWQGDHDVNVPLAMAQYLARTIPNSELRIYANEGHLMYLSHWQEIIETLSAD